MENFGPRGAVAAALSDQTERKPAHVEIQPSAPTGPPDFSACSTTEDRVALLLPYLDPKGMNFEKVRLIQKHLANGVQLAPKDYELLDKLQDKFTVYRCQWFIRGGGCKKFGECKHVEERSFRECFRYRPEKGNYR